VAVRPHTESHTRPDEAASHDPEDFQPAQGCADGASRPRARARSTASAVPGAVPGEAEAPAAPGTVGLLTGHLPSYDEVANVAVFAASDWARTITASEINFTGGAVVD
jgi:hypothetical protein